MFVMSVRSLPRSLISISTVIHRATQLLVPLALLLTTYLYLYPVFHGCTFTSIDGSFQTALSDALFQHRFSKTNPIDERPHLAPFRLLVLADPQLEGDSSLPDPEDALPNKIARYYTRLTELDVTDIANVTVTVQELATQFVTEDIPSALQAVRKRIDLFGNDFYLAHIFRTMHWWTKPTHVTVLGDLIGSQWVDDEEFEWRGWRYWNRVFARMRKVDDEIMEMSLRGQEASNAMDDPRWTDRIIHLAGNHDIGYAGDITAERLQRFEKMYGLANWDVRFEYPLVRLNQSEDRTRPSIHVVILNSMLLDTPAMDEELQAKTYQYLNDVTQHRLRPVEDHSDFTLVLTHVPLHKKEGVCVDGPMFNFFDEDGCTEGDCRIGGLREQNHLSVFASQSGMLAAFFGMNGDLDTAESGRGRPGLVLTGHDHEGCDTWHYIPKNTTYKSLEPQTGEEGEEAEERKTVWDASKWCDANEHPSHTGVREVTLRSMMGEFGGNAGLLSAWFDFGRGEWEYDIQMCRLGVQHIWWAIHIIDLIAILAALASFLLWAQRIAVTKHTSRPTGKKSTKVE